MFTMKSYLFQLKCPSGDLRIDTIRADIYPKAGDHLTIFNFPVIERYVIERLEVRPEWWAQDHCDQMALVVRLDGVVQTAANTGNVIAFNQDTNLETRLAKIEKVARKAIDTSLLLEISRDDFKALCTGSGLSVEIDEIDAFAYHDIPIKLGEAGEWNAATAFTGYSDDRHVLYVTCPGGTPFVMNATLLEVSKLFSACKLSTEMALARAMAEAVDRGCAETSGLQTAMRNMLGLMQDGIMPMYDGAQELTRMTDPAYAAALAKTWANREVPVAPEGTRFVEVSGIGRVDVAGLVDALTGLNPTRH
jgi:hypothetical protein